ncbi:hypothetical protein WAI453_002050 [Rhynchosporium graminicola]
MLPIPSEESSEVTVQEFIASYLEAICRINTEEAIALSRRFRGSGIALYMMTTQEYTEMFGDTRIWSVKMRMEVHKETLKPAVQRISRRRNLWRVFWKILYDSLLHIIAILFTITLTYWQNFNPGRHFDNRFYYTALLLIPIQAFGFALAVYFDVA